MTSKNVNWKEATFGAGCFWCVDAVFRELEGVNDVLVGYSGGHVKNPAYREVCMGTTGHVEVARISYDPEVVSYEALLEVFFRTHDPTTLNRQGADVGEQYRSVIFYHDEEQRELAEKAKEAMDQTGGYADPVVTAIEPLTHFYPAEDYHRNYFANHPDAPYCQAVIRPKMEKFRKVFAQLRRAD